MSIIDRVNNNLATLYDIENEIYKSFICDQNGIIPSEITKPTDIDIGAITSQIEYLRQLSICLVRQLFLDEAAEEFLAYQLTEFFGSLRLENESDVDWVQRTIATVFQPKVSRATLIFSLRPYSSEEPVIENVLSDAMFANYSFASRYRKFRATWSGSEKTVYPATSRNFAFSLFTIRIVLVDTPTNKLFTVGNIIRGVLAAGISYELVIRSS